MASADPSTRRGPVYGRGFFDLQLAFAGRVADLSGVPPERALLDYTNLYIRFGLGRAFDAAHPTWRAYLAGLHTAADGGEWTHRFYAARAGADGRPDVVAEFGCFSYGRLSGDRIRLHFQNAEPPDRSPLGADRRDQRLAELDALFAHVERAAAPAPRVVGASWLYNLEAYRRLFPPAYLATARAVDGRFRHMPLWGQFLDRRGEVKEPVARELLGRLDRARGLDDLDRCFPLPVLTLEAPAHEFCDFYRASREWRSGVYAGLDGHGATPRPPRGDRP